MSFLGLSLNKNRKKEKAGRKKAEAEAEELRRRNAALASQAAGGAQTTAEQEAEIARLARELEERDKRLSEEGWKEGEELFNRDVKGLTPEQRRVIESNARRRLNRSLQGAQRDVLASQGASGIRGPAAYAQQQDIRNAAREAEGDFYRDLEEYDPELALKKLAMMFNVQQGRRAQGHLNRQQALDEMRLREERAKQRELQEYFRGQFGRI